MQHLKTGTGGACAPLSEILPAARAARSVRMTEVPRYSLCQHYNESGKLSESFLAIRLTAARENDAEHFCLRFAFGTLLLCGLYRIVSIDGRRSQATDSGRRIGLHLPRISCAASHEYLARAADPGGLWIHQDAAEAVEGRGPVAYRDRFRFAEENFP